MNGFIIPQLIAMNHIQVSQPSNQLADIVRLTGLASTGGAGE
jgi:hypothetical protein